MFSDKKYICPRVEGKHNWNLKFNRIPIWDVAPDTWSALYSWQNIIQRVTIEMLHYNTTPAALWCYSICIFHPNWPFSLHHVIHLFNFMQAGRFPSAALEKNLIMENNLMLVNNVKQAALNCPGPAGFIIQSKFNYFLRKQLGRSLLSMLSNSIL